MAEENAKSGRMVCMGCKLPNGLRMRLFKAHTEPEPVMGGGVRDVQRFRQHGGSIILNGNRLPVDPNTGMPLADTHTIVGGYGLTLVPEEFAKEWWAANKDSELVKSGQVFLVNSEAEARKEAKGHEKVTSGLEPLSTEMTTLKDGRVVPADPRFPKSINQQVSVVPNVTRGDLG